MFMFLYYVCLTYSTKQRKYRRGEENVDSQDVLVIIVVTAIAL